MTGTTLTDELLDALADNVDIATVEVDPAIMAMLERASHREPVGPVAVTAIADLGFVAGAQQPADAPTPPTNGGHVLAPRVVRGRVPAGKGRPVPVRGERSRGRVQTMRKSNFARHVKTCHLKARVVRADRHLDPA